MGTAIKYKSQIAEIFLSSLVLRNLTVNLHCFKLGTTHPTPDFVSFHLFWQKS